jgi:hypothetical protein
MALLSSRCVAGRIRFAYGRHSKTLIETSLGPSAQRSVAVASILRTLRRGKVNFAERRLLTKSFPAFEAEFRMDLMACAHRGEVRGRVLRNCNYFNVENQVSTSLRA